MNPLLASMPADLGAAYLQRNPDVAASPLFRDDPLAHYQKYGQMEGRVWDGPVAAATPAFAPVPNSLYGNDAAGWDTYRSAAQASAEGMNRMPFVFSNFANVPTDPQMTNALFFQDGQAALEANPLLSGLALANRQQAAPLPVVDRAQQEQMDKVKEREAYRDRFLK
jgi:hypothetical protein